MIRLAMKPKIVKLLEENKGDNLYDLGLGRDFLDMTKKKKKGGSIKEQIDNLHFIKIKNFYLSKDTVK